MALFSVTGLSFVIVRCGQSEEAAWSCKNLDALISFVEENMESTSYRILLFKKGLMVWLIAR